MIGCKSFMPSAYHVKDVRDYVFPNCFLYHQQLLALLITVPVLFLVPAATGAVDSCTSLQTIGAWQWLWWIFYLLFVFSVVALIRFIHILISSQLFYSFNRAWNSSRKQGFSQKWKLKITGKNIFREKKINKHTFFFQWKLRWWICECKLKVQNRHSSKILVC